jgi:hypothetical protein
MRNIVLDIIVIELRSASRRVVDRLASAVSMEGNM